MEEILINSDNKRSKLLHKSNFLIGDLRTNHKSLIEELFTTRILDKFKDSGSYISHKKSHQAIWIGEVDYKYGKYKTMKSFMDPEVIEPIMMLARLVEIQSELSYGYLNSCYINKFTNGGIGTHHDNDSIFKIDKSWNGGKDIKVAVISIGGNARISIFDSYNSSKELNSLLVTDGSLYLMDNDFQNNFYHKVGISDGIRYSLTYRHTV